MIFNTRNTDFSLNKVLGNVKNALANAEFNDPRSRKFVEELLALPKIDSREVIYDICISEFASVKESITKKEDISLPGIGRFRYNYYSEVRRDYLNSLAKAKGYEDFFCVYDKDIREEIKAEAKRLAIEELKASGFYDKKSSNFAKPLVKSKRYHPEKRTHAKVFTFSIPR